MSKLSSNIDSFNLKNKTKDIQGGEKKVMKKSLSVVLSTAMALSMFSSLAFAAKSSADFTDLKDLDAATKAKFDAMISAGIFDGVSDTTFGLKDEMNRAQFAKVAALITGIEVNKDLKTSSFSDVKADDAANGYALPYIEALKTAGITDGYAEGQYNPAGKVTKEQLATFLVRVLGKDADAKGKTGTDTTVSDWAQGYVALALELKLLPTGDAGKFGGQSNATRDLLLTGAYEAKAQYVAPGKVAVTEAKATGVQQVTVSFNKPVDTDKAKVSLKQGTADVVTTTKFADDKKSAVLTLTDTTIKAGEYTATLSGIDEANLGTATGKFTGQNEVLTKVDFVSANDTVAQASSVIIKAKATNQYGENASFSAGNYNGYVTGAVLKKISKDNDGNLLVTIDTTTTGAGGAVPTPNVSITSITLISNDSSHISATKNYKIGTTPIFSKLELGSARYSNGKTALAGKGENVKFDLNIYDQYGSLMPYDSNEANFAKPKTSLIFSDYFGADNTDYSYAIEDNGNNIAQLKISLNKEIDKSGDFNFTVLNQAAIATGKLTVQSQKVATKVEIGDLNDVIAAGDDDAYVPIVAYDASGNKLSLDDLTSDDNVARITVNVSGVTGTGATTPKILQSGEHRGTVKLDGIATNSKGAVTVTAIIVSPNAQSTATKTYTIQDVRKPDRLKEVTAPAANLVAGGKSFFQYQVLDQYGKVMKKVWNNDGNGNALASGGISYTVELVDAAASKSTSVSPAFTNGASVSTVGVTTDDDPGKTGSVYQVYSGRVKETSFETFNDGFRFYTPVGTTDTGYKFFARIVKHDGSSNTEVAKVEKDITVITSADLTYSVNSLGNLANVLDSGVAKNSGVTSATYAFDTASGTRSRFGKEIKVSATNNAGDAVGLPGVITGATSSDTNVAVVGYDATGKKAYVLGNKTGTATINVTYMTLKGDYKNITLPVTVKNDTITVETFTAANSNFTMAAGSTFNVYDAIDGKVVDNYGLTFDGKAGGNLQLYAKTFGLVYVAQHLSYYGDKTGGAADQVTFDYATGIATVGSNVKGFDLTVSAPNGKQVTTEIKRPAN